MATAKGRVELAQRLKGVRRGQQQGQRRALGESISARGEALKSSPRERRAVAKYDKAHPQGGGKGGGGGGGFDLGDLGDIAKDVVGKGLEVIDVPRSYATGTVSGIVKSFENIAAGHGDLGDIIRGPVAGGLAATGVGAPIAAALEQTDPQVRRDVKRHTGVGQYFERGLRKHGWEDAVPDPVKIGVGIAGDVGLDPLTYIGGAGIARKGGASLAKGLGEAAAAADAAGDTAKGARLAEAAVQAVRKGPGAVGKAERTEVVARELQRIKEVGGTAKQVARAERELKQAEQGGAFIGLGSHKAHIPGSEKLTDPLNAIANKTTREVRARAGDALKNSKVWNKMSGATPGLEAKARDTSDVRGAIEAIAAKDKSARWELVKAHDEGQLHDSANDLLKQAKRQGMKEDDIRAGLQGEGPLVGDQRLAPFREWFDNARQEAVDEGVDVGYVEDYLMRLVKKHGKGEARISPSAKIPQEYGRLKKGQVNPFDPMGRRLEGETPAAVQRELDDAYAAMHGGERMYDTDLKEIMRRYGSTIAERKKQKRFWADMEESGFTRPATDKIEATNRALAARAEEAAKVADANRAVKAATAEVPSVKGTTAYRVHYTDGASGRKGVHEAIIHDSVGDSVQRKLAAEQEAYQFATPGHEAAFQVGTRPTEIVPQENRILDELTAVTTSGHQSPQVSDNIARFVDKNHGVTFNPRTNEALERGYMVGVPEGQQTAWVGPRDKLAEGVAKVRADYGIKMQEDPALMLGVGRRSDGLYAVDPSIRATDIDEALDIAHKRGQQSLFDANNGVEINIADAMQPGTPSHDAVLKARKYDRELGAIKRSGPEATRDVASVEGGDQLGLEINRAQERLDTLVARDDIPKAQEHEVELARSYVDRASDNLLKVAGQDNSLARSVRYLAQGDLATAEAIEAGHRALPLEELASQLRNKKVQGHLVDEAGRMLKTMQGEPGAISADVAEALTKVAKFEDPGWPLKVYDHLLKLTKGFQISTGGFHIRNAFGGSLNNWLDGVNPLNYLRWDRAKVAFKRGEEAFAKFEAKHPEVARAYREFKDLIDHGQIGSESLSGRNASVLQRINPASPKNAWLNLHHKMGEAVEERLRGAAAMDHLIKHPGDLDGAVRRVHKLHFNYQDLSNFERGTVKRVIPFYTWTRRNLPLQFEMFVRRPGVYNHYEQIRREAESVTPNEDIVPNWYGQERMLRLPFTQGGARAYVNTGAPQEDLLSGHFADWQQYAGMVSPLIKTPFEVWSGKKVFRDIPLSQKEVEAPGAWGKIPGLMGAMEKFGLAKRAGGKWVMRDQDAYVVDQYLPVLSQARRMWPTEDKYKYKVTAAWVRMAAFPGLRFNTKREQRNERLRRKYER